MLMTVWWLANKETYRQVGDRFSCTRGNVVDQLLDHNFFIKIYFVYRKCTIYNNEDLQSLIKNECKIHLLAGKG